MGNCQVRFIHTADVHIDSPMKALEAYDGAPIELLRGATRRALENVVRLAIDERVAFVIIAGDLFDGSWPDMQTGLWTSERFRELQRAGIAVYLLRGNHDAESRMRRSLSWPANVHEFSVRKPKTFTIPEHRIALHGQGFAGQQQLEDLACHYPDAIPGWFNIGVLHTSLTGAAGHDTYAPTSPEVLVARGYDYWALGHVHARSEPPICRRPYIAYSGNTQARRLREAGPCGCLLATVGDGELLDVSFRATDVVRWSAVDVPLDDTADRWQVFEAVRSAVAATHERNEGRMSAMRLTLTGRCRSHHELVRPGSADEIVNEIRNVANEVEGVWIEKVVIHTSPPVDLERLRDGNDLVGELLRHVETIRADDEHLRSLFAAIVAQLERHSAEIRQAEIDFSDPDQLECWLRQAERLLVSELMEASSSS